MIALPKKLSPLLGIMLSLVLLACVGFIDIASGHLVIVLLYFLPIGIAAWFVGKRAGLAICIISVGLWLVDYLRYDYRGLGPAFWDAGITLGIFFCYSIVLAALKTARDSLEQGARDLEIRVAERTSELRDAETLLRTLNTTLERRANQLRDLMIELSDTEERERRRIAQILHDHLQQILVGAKFSVTGLEHHLSEPETIHKGLQSLVASLDEAIAESRALTAELAPPVLYERGLPEALHWLARWMEERHGISVGVSTDDRPDELNQNLRILMFQGIRELLFNVVKHAQVKEASVTLCYRDNEMVAATVRDEGIGFDPQAGEKGGRSTLGGFGLFSIQERLAAMGGRLEIESAPGRGTAGTIYAPVRSSAKKTAWEM